MNYGISCDPGSKNASPAVWCWRLKCGACTCNSTGKRHSRSWPESAIQNRPQRRRAADPAQHVPHRRFLVRPAPLCNAGARLAPAHAPHRRAFRPAHRALRQRLRRAFLLGGCSQVMPAVFVPRDGAPGVQSRQNAGRRTRNARQTAAGCNVKPDAAKKGSRSGTAQPFGRCGQHLEIRNDSQYAQNRYFGLYVACSGMFLRRFRGLHCAKAS